MLANTKIIREINHPLNQNYEACTGCLACVASCPNNAIDVNTNTEGFIYPRINNLLCNDCGLCQDTCPVYLNIKSTTKIKKLDEEKILDVYAAWHLDDKIRKDSSSGGVFSALAEEVIKMGGVVVGAAFDEHQKLYHVLIERRDDLEILRGSKYLQSEIRPELYIKIREVLEQKRTLLFSGTPCQVAGLNSLLCKAYENLICCDVACHGVPSPKVFDAYKIMLEKQYKANVRRIAFRRKNFGWKRYSVLVSFENNTEYRSVYNEDPFMLGFLRNLYLRPSCYVCQFACIDRPGDITFADFWGVGEKYPEYDKDDKGTSLILVNSAQGNWWFNQIRKSLFVGIANIDTAVKGNPILSQPSVRPLARDTFFRDLGQISFEEVIRKYQLYVPSLIQKYFRAIKRRIKRVMKHKTINGHNFPA
ncbi:MAG TPA: Coenzyme F420 hydrogenase/dehydrogenase, beta subunit C-terminal domain [Smithellaceae bacterium]|nr:Coenzyme F420 hydrogenase/dehydrogenase, beta subunit C-terminal domain [Smithellaceae bacterium]